MKIIKKYDNYILIVLCIILISILGLWNLPQMHSIGIIPDEFGYWSSSAFFSGYDWSVGMTVTPYYGYFYGIVLMPIFNIFIEDSVNMFRAAIILNGILLDICFLCTYSFFQRLSNDKEHSKRYIIAALFITLYPAYLLFVRVTLSEIILLLITWIVVLEFSKYIEKRNIRDLVALYILAIIGYFCHQRFLVVIIASLLAIFLLHIINNGLDKKNLIQLVFVAFAILIVFILGTYGKSWYKDVAYNQALSAIKSTNDYGSVMNKILSLFSISGICDLVFSVIGKLFYIGVATWGIAYVGIFLIVEYLYKCIKDKRKDNQLFIYIFLLFAFVGSVLLAAIMMKNRPDVGERFDTLIYGRYSENLYGPLLVIALICLFKDYKKFLQLEIYAFLLECLLLIVVLGNVIENPSYAVQWLSCSAINEFFYHKDYGMDSAFCMLVLRNGIFIALLFLGLFIKKQVKLYYQMTLVVVGICLFIYSSLYTVDNVYFSFQEKVYQENQALVEMIQDEKAEDKIYSINETKYITALQFVMPKMYIEHVESIEEIPNNEILVTPSSYEGGEHLLLITEGKYLKLWKYIK